MGASWQSAVARVVRCATQGRLPFILSSCSVSCSWQLFLGRNPLLGWPPPSGLLLHGILAITLLFRLRHWVLWHRPYLRSRNSDSQGLNGR